MINNLLYAVGDNSSLQCSSINKKIIILKPYLVNKTKEFCDECTISKIYTTGNETIMVIDPFQI